MTPLQAARLSYQPKLPPIFHHITDVHLEPTDHFKDLPKEIAHYFPATRENRFLNIVAGKKHSHDPLKVGVVFSGGQASGGHNVITGLFDALKKLNPASRLYGFLDGPSGIIENRSIELTENMLSSYRNQGGFDLIGSGRTKIETPQQFQGADAAVKALNLDGLVIIGGDDSNTNAALLAEYFIKVGTKTKVIGVPKTIDGDLKNDHIEISFGFDSAIKTYSELIANLQRDALSAKKYYFFVKLMGRSASHVALECALQTHSNLTLIGEEIKYKKATLKQLVNQIADLVVKREAAGKNYGVILIPEGIIEFIPEMGVLVDELNTLLAKNPNFVATDLTTASRNCYESLPKEIQQQLLLERDSHGNVQVSKIETERLFIDMVKAELKQRTKAGEYKGKFSPQGIFYGYEGRSCLPTNFDAQYCYALGYTAAVLIDGGATGYICAIRHLADPVDKWKPEGVPLNTMMGLQKRQGEMRPVIEKSYVELNGKVFEKFAKDRQQWMIEDDYQMPGPIQFFGPPELTDLASYTISLNRS